LTDTYTGEKFAANDKKNLDHIIAAHEIHNDPGRILAECDGADLANDSSNLTFTNESLNKAKKAKTMDAFVQTLQEQHAVTTQEIARLRSQPTLSEQEQKQLNKLENKAAADFERMKRLTKGAGKIQQYDQSGILYQQQVCEECRHCHNEQCISHGNAADVGAGSGRDLV
jgi:hypothetical protein